MSHSLEKEMGSHVLKDERVSLGGHGREGSYKQRECYLQRQEA